jgi:eukaryotic-like serine/threonine-protein kinase
MSGPMAKPEDDNRHRGMSQADLRFLMQTPLFDAIPEDAKFHLLAAMKRRIATPGERIMNQGEDGDCFYVIQEGTCQVNLEKDGVVHPLAVLRPGDTVGEMAVLTGEIRSADVDAQADMVLWRIGKEEFERICVEYPELRQFLTGIVSSRFARSRLTADRTVGKYVISTVTGHGGWSIVYKGVHKALDMPVAIKMLKHNLAMDEGFLEQFHNEARTIASLNHENIVKVYDIEELYRTVFIVMEYLDGVPLEALLRVTERLPVAKALSVLLQVCAGLKYAHERGIVHRDIKPANIFLLRDDGVKILDFGLACAPGTCNATRLEGTPMYVSPEQIRGKPVDERSDIYSLGISFYKIITGKRAFEELDVTSLLNLHLYEDVPDPRAGLPDLPDELYKFLMRSTKKNPEDRYQNIDEIVHDVRPLAEKLGIPITGSGSQRFNMTTLFLFYRDEHRETVRRVVEEFTEELEKIGAVLRQADFKDVH